MLKQYLEIGKIVSTQGLNGEVRVEPWCDSPEFLCSFKTLYFNEGKERINVVCGRKHKRISILKIDKIDSIEEAEKLRGKILYVNRDDVKLEEGTNFISDIMGLKVFDYNDNKFYGKITEVYKTGANDVYQITDESGKNYLIPVIKEVIRDINIDDGKLIISPLKGIFDED